MSSQEKKHTLLKAIGLTAAAGAAAYGGYGYYIFRTFFDLSRSSLHTGGPESLPYGYGARQEWLDHSDRQDVFIDSFDGLQLHGHAFTNQFNAGFSWICLRWFFRLIVWSHRWDAKKIRRVS